MSPRSIAFYAILVLSLMPGFFVIVYLTDINGWGEVFGGGRWLEYIARGAPFVTADASLFGQITPAILAGALAVLSPAKRELTALVVSLLLCAGGWVLYLALSMLLADGTPHFQAAETYFEVTTNNVADVKVVQSFVSSARVFFLVVAATLVGLRLKTGD